MIEELERSREVTAVLRDNILKRDPTYNRELKEAQLQVQKEVKKKKAQKKDDVASQLMQAMDKSQKRVMMLSQEKGASHWLNVLPIKEHGFSLHKEAFRDALC